MLSASVFEQNVKKRAKKGTGPDAKRDPRDGYNFRNGRSFNLTQRWFGRALPLKLLSPICTLIASRSLVPLTKLNRFAKRRMSNAYCWLDENHDRIDPNFLRQCFNEVQMAPLIHLDLGFA
jgi:hypothetical protein